MSTRYKVTLVNGDEFHEDSFSAAAGRIAGKVRRIGTCYHAELDSGETDIGKWYDDYSVNGFGNREWTVCINCRHVANSKRDFAYIEEESE